MTRRIAIAILLTVWAILIAAGVSTYLVTRSVLLVNLDDAIVQRAKALPQITDPLGRHYRNTSPIRSDDRFIVRNMHNQTLRRVDDEAELSANAVPPPQIVNASFSTLP